MKSKLIELKKKIESKDKTKYDNFYSRSRAEIIINESDIDDVFQSIYTTVITNIQKSLGISKYNPLAGSSYIKLPKELDHPRKGLIDVQNTDENKYFKWCIVRHLNPTDHNPKRITKGDKYFEKRLDLKDIKFPVKIRDIHKIEQKNSIGISVFGYENKEKYQKILQRKTC